MSLEHYRRQISALQRKLAVPLSVVRLRPLAKEYCDQWASAVAEGKEPPPVTPVDASDSGDHKTKPFVERVSAAGFRISTRLDLRGHIQRCRRERRYPHHDDILRILLPKAAVCGLIPKSPPPASY